MTQDPTLIAQPDQQVARRNSV